MTERVGVTQADREAALAFRLFTTSLKPDDYRAVHLREQILGGAWDTKETVQAFARHREAAYRAGMMRARDIAQSFRKWQGSNPIIDSNTKEWITEAIQKEIDRG